MLYYLIVIAMKNIYVCFLYRKRKRSVASWLDGIHPLWYPLKPSEPCKPSFWLLLLSSRLLLATQKDGIEGYCKAHTAVISDSIRFGDPTPQPLKQRNKASASVSTLVTSVSSVTISQDEEDLSHQEHWSQVSQVSQWITGRGRSVPSGRTVPLFSC